MNARVVFTMNDETLVEVRNIKKFFPINEGLFGQTTGHIHAVDDISFRIRRGSVFGLVGESGSGKTTVGRALLGLYPLDSGSITFQGQELSGLSRTQWHPLRPKMQLVFQDPYGALNPRMRIGDAIGEAVLEHRLLPPAALRDRVIQVMETCGLPAAHYHRYPHEFSGGQRQRIGIARALILQPEFIVADEPVSALDVSIQAQIINLFADLRDDFGVTFLFISHDLGVVEHFCDDVAVMYLGQIVEYASRDQLFRQPRHPYTQALLAAVPTLDCDAPLVPATQGEPPNPAAPPGGCRFHPRCPHARDNCRSQAPERRDVAPGHSVACHYT
ncbi:peptide/nickel transport system ATP-binding protein [Sodalis ligni]|uniref:Peptide/nickel transport system ATP-binding protein n=2 Tax=Sodalis ligni TaxID=2697027 RepID=A0A4R1NGU7_9GAMM|nr:peptide/nickel transport system ATP-binding protein [Sodalis ligni]